ncbi:unnamed protein product [Sphagnum jensenii]|uniref:Uncharacterized protein n=1 Tax=Sphagnum jensenii TaxID=128206 RepID=A0ABP0W4Z8_9BRYO
MTKLDRFNWIGFRAKEVLQAYIEINTSGRLEDLGIRHMEDCTLEFFCDAEFHRDQETEAAKLIQALRDSNAGHDHHTTEIQRIFNGFYICKHSICMSDHKGFLQSALQQQEVVKKLLRSKYRIQCRAQQEKAEKTLKDQLEKWIDSKHHLVCPHLSPPIPFDLSMPAADIEN